MTVQAVILVALALTLSVCLACYYSRNAATDLLHHLLVATPAITIARHLPVIDPPVHTTGPAILLTTPEPAAANKASPVNAYLYSD